MIVGSLLPCLQSVRTKLARLSPAGTFAEGLLCRILTIISGSLVTMVKLTVLSPNVRLGLDAEAVVK